MAELTSVITPTWGRHQLLLDRCIPSVLAQDHPVEHVIVSDGYEPDLYPQILDRFGDAVADGRIRYDELPGKGSGRWGHSARLRGIQVARGSYLAWLDDDNSFRPDHVSRLAVLLDAGAQFAYGVILFHNYSSDYPVGGDPPCLGAIDTSAIMNRRDLHETATWRDEGQQTVDWDLVERWMAAGATWGFDPQVTADYYVGGCG